MRFFTVGPPYRLLILFLCEQRKRIKKKNFFGETVFRLTGKEVMKMHDTALR